MHIAASLVIRSLQASFTGHTSIAHLGQTCLDSRGLPKGKSPRCLQHPGSRRCSRGGTRGGGQATDPCWRRIDFAWPVLAQSVQTLNVHRP
jgi:hypothetical protein